MHFFFLPYVKLPYSFLALLHHYRKVVIQRTDSFSNSHRRNTGRHKKRHKTGYIKEKVSDNIIGYTLKPFGDVVPGGPAGL
jgi:hypothetical protein